MATTAAKMSKGVAGLPGLLLRQDEVPSWQDYLEVSCAADLGSGAHTPGPFVLLAVG
uniref:Uncharacterized protein n=1 Tax=Oryza sativa subsp. japonica TaxID=39947 RepID=Q69SJ4_ORYSJ|nr:hypothetical protein [Oryza sativa Japonica Group]